VTINVNAENEYEATELAAQEFGNSDGDIVMFHGGTDGVIYDVEVNEIEQTVNDPSDNRVRVAPGAGTDLAPDVEPKRHRRTYRCGCHRSIAAYPDDMAEAPIVCGRCGEDFS